MIGVIADVHANLPALQAVLEKLSGVEKIYCAGDLVGYGPYFSEVIDLVKKEGMLCIMGNHDYAVLDPSVEDWFNPVAMWAIQFTRERLSASELSFLRGLPWKINTDEFTIVHGSPSDPLFEYLLNPSPSRTLLVVGHSHIQFFKNNVLNPGSVGQPRDEDPRAAYAVIKNGKVELRRVKYPVEEVAEEIVKVGLPPMLADRLFEGR